METDHEKQHQSMFILSIDIKSCALLRASVLKMGVEDRRPNNCHVPWLIAQADGLVICRPTRKLWRFV
jgi:hypothetical protein